jgi:hypothetical protein
VVVFYPHKFCSLIVPNNPLICSQHRFNRPGCDFLYAHPPSLGATTSIRRTLRECIQKGRDAGGKVSELWEAYKLSGQGPHTLEDFTARSDWVEVTLRKLGHNGVFC